MFLYLENFVAEFVLEFLWLHAESTSVGSDFILQSSHNANRRIFLLATQTVRGTNHLDTAHELGMPIVLLQASCKVGVLFVLEKLVVVLGLLNLLHVLVVTEVADHFHDVAKGRLIFAE